MVDFQSYGVIPNGGGGNKKREFYRLGSKIELLMNLNDSDYDSLLALLDEFVYKSSATEYEIFEFDERYVAICQRILKREWNRIKSDFGE